MPTYEYTCRDCGHTFEIVQSMWDDALTMCPECGGSLRKVFAPPAISFKGSGYYATDHGKKAKKSSDSDGEKSGVDTGGKDKVKDKKESKDTSSTATTSSMSTAKPNAGPKAGKESAAS
jgi:putative FmdB family regulatory protein